MNKKKEVNNKEIDNKNNKSLVIPLIIIIVFLLVIISILVLKKDAGQKCDAPIEKEVIIEKEPNYQLINYQGFRFKMPMDWSFVSSNNNYEISNKEDNLFITLDHLEEDFSLFVSDEYQRKYLENIQTTSNTKIEQSKNMEKYYYYEGLNNDYNYIIIAVGNNEKVVLVKAQFIDKISFDKLKNSVVEFSISYLNVK